VDNDFRVGTWLVQPQLNSVSQNGIGARLEPKAMQVLVRLAESADEVVPKDRLLRAVWGDTFVTEDVLTRSISALRHAFRDSAQQPRFIQTIPKGGYRLIAPVEWIDRKPDVESVVVLPFVNASGDSELEYLSDGITDSIIHWLSQLPQLRVMARSTAYRYKGREGDAQGVGKELSVRSVLTGRIIRRGEVLVVRAELVDVVHGWQLWGDQFVRQRGDVLTLEDEIARKISATLQLRLTGEQQEHLARRPTVNHEAYHLYLKGRYLWNRRTDASLKKAIEFFERAVTRDPRYALAYVGLADSYALLACQVAFGSLDPLEAHPKATEAARKALDLDGDLAEAHASLGNVLASYDWNWSAAEQEFRRAIELNAGYASAHHWYAEMLSYVKRLDEAFREIHLALELDPLSLGINTDAAWILYCARQYDAAVEQLRKVLDLEPEFLPARTLLAVAYEMKGQQEAALAEFQAAQRLFRQASIPVAMRGYVLAAGGEEDRGKGWQELQELGEPCSRDRRLSRNGDLPACCLAAYYTHLGKTALALDHLEKAFAERSNWLASLAVDPIFDGLRSEPRFQELVRRIGLPAETVGWFANRA
jgi:TolB-like protein/tetratricopeptide (TPR) repeat protein